MRTLAIETTEKIGTIALFEDQQCVVQVELNPQQRTARSLAVGLKQLFEDQCIRAEQLDLVTVASGPGSFTGLRVGVTTAKSLSYAARADILGINTLEAIAIAGPEDVPIWCVLDAQRQQVFAAQFRRTGAQLEAILPTDVYDIETWLDQLHPGQFVAGPVLSKLLHRLPDEIRAVDSHLWPPKAAAVGQLAVHYYQQGRRDDVWQLVPQYYRKSAAEEKWDAGKDPN